MSHGIAKKKIDEELLSRTPNENGPVWPKINFTPARIDTVSYPDARVLIVSIYYDNQIQGKPLPPPASPFSSHGITLPATLGWGSSLVFPMSP